MKGKLMTLLLGAPLCASAQVSYFNDFQSNTGWNEWSDSRTVDLDGNGRVALGAFNPNDFSQELTANLFLSGFTVGQKATITFDLCTLGDWQGNNEGDWFYLQIGNADTALPLNATFSNFAGVNQSYAPGLPGGGSPVQGRTGADEIDTLSNYTRSAVYKFGGANNAGFTFTPTSKNVSFFFGMRTGWGPDVESWAVDNVRVTQSAVPEPTTTSVVGLGLMAILRRRRSRTA